MAASISPSRSIGTRLPVKFSSIMSGMSGVRLRRMGTSSGSR